jgi:hypothetical protein
MMPRRTTEVRRPQAWQRRGQRSSDGAAAQQPEAASLPLLRLLLAADALDAPRAVAAAAAVAAARALRREGADADAAEEGRGACGRARAAKRVR